MAGNALVEWLSQFCGRRTTLLLWAAGVSTPPQPASGWWVPSVGRYPFLISMAALGVNTGPSGLSARLTPSEQRAIVSFDLMIGNSGAFSADRPGLPLPGQSIARVI
jgi:hypothetical protein